MTTQVKKESTLPNNKFDTTYILSRFGQGKRLLKLLGTGSTQEYADYLQYADELQISLQSAGQLTSFARTFDRPAFVAAIFEHPYFTEAILRRAYDGALDTPDHLITLLAEKGVPYHGILTLAQQSVQDAFRIRYTRLVLLGLLPPLLRVIQQLTRDQVEDDTQRLWLSWLSDRELEKLVGQPGASVRTEEEMPEELKTPYDNLPAVPPGFPVEPTGFSGSVLAAYAEVDTRTLPEELQEHIERAEIVSLVSQNGHDSSENNLIQARILLQLEKNEATYYEIDSLKANLSNANAIIQELLHRNEQLELQLVHSKAALHVALSDVVDAHGIMNRLLILNGYTKQEEEVVIDTTDPDFVTQFKGFTGGKPGSSE